MMTVTSEPTVMRGEIVNVMDGTGAVEVRGNELACGLFLHGKPFVLNWNDNAGSVGQEALLDTHTAEEAHTLFRQFTLEGPTDYTTLEKYFAPLMHLFAPGAYGLAYGVAPEGGLVHWWNTVPHSQTSYYPFPHEILPTLPEEKINDERVLQYMESIEKGKRPLVISATVPRGWCDFIVDGHHKMSAYHLLGISPPCLRITALSARPLDVSDWPDHDPPRNFIENLTLKGT